MDIDPGRLSLTVQLLIIVALTFINAFFAMAEMAIVSSSKAKLKAIADDTSDGDARAERVLLLMEDPNKFLSAIQVAITLAGFLSSAFASVNLAGKAVFLFSNLGINLNYQLAVVIITVLLSYITLVFGELYPKRVALKDPEAIAMKSVGTILFTKKIFTPFVFILSVSVEGLVKLFKQDVQQDNSEYMEEEIMNILEEGQEQGGIDESGMDMINAVFEFDDAFAYEIMTPRTDVYMVDVNKKLEDYLDEMLENRFARVPFYDEDQDDIIGVLFIKDFIIEAKNVGFLNVDVRSLLKKPYLVPENKKINDLLEEMQHEKQSIAIIIDEYGGFAGIVTIEDLLEEIVGSIEDEFEDDAPDLEQQDENTFIVDGLYDLEELEEEIDVEFLTEDENAETVGGFVTELSGEIPNEESVGQVYSFKNIDFKIVEVGDKRIEKVEVKVNEEPKTEE